MRKIVDATEEEYKSFSREGTYSIDYLIGEEAFLKKGIGKIIVKRLIEMIHAHSDARLIVVQPDLENTSSCNVLRANEFLFDDDSKVFYKNI